MESLPTEWTYDVLHELLKRDEWNKTKDIDALLRRFQSSFTFNSLIGGWTDVDDEFEDEFTFATFLIVCDGDDGWHVYLCKDIDKSMPLTLYTLTNASFLDVMSMREYATAFLEFSNTIERRRQNWK